MSRGRAEEFIHRHAEPQCEPGFVLGAGESGRGLDPSEEFTALGEGDARLEPPSLTSTCSLHLCY